MQHFLLSAMARSVSLRMILGYSDREAIALFSKIRWGSTTEQTCPHCGVIENHRWVPLQKRWRCRSCYKAFSVTSGTVFAHHKLPLQLILGAIVLYANAVKGLSALQMSRDLDVQYKTAFVLLHKIRESLFKQRDTSMMSGEVEIDGGYVHTYVRPANKITDRVDRREHPNPNKCAILVLRERHSRTPDEYGNLYKGARRTRTFIVYSENSQDVRDILRRNVHPGSIVYTDESPAYATLSSDWDHQVVKHGEEFSSESGANENQSESYISRFRRLLIGQIHRLSQKYLDVYANEIAYREDRRRESNGDTVGDLVERCLKCRQSQDWSKYWQKNRRRHGSIRSDLRTA